MEQRESVCTFASSMCWKQGRICIVACTGVRWNSSPRMTPNAKFVAGRTLPCHPFRGAPGCAERKKTPAENGGAPKTKQGSAGREYSSRQLDTKQRLDVAEAYH